jgi:hypothetical protein
MGHTAFTGGVRYTVYRYPAASHDGKALDFYQKKKYNMLQNNHQTLTYYNFHPFFLASAVS